MPAAFRNQIANAAFVGHQFTEKSYTERGEQCGQNPSDLVCHSTDCSSTISLYGARNDIDTLKSVALNQDALPDLQRRKVFFLAYSSSARVENRWHCAISSANPASEIEMEMTSPNELQSVLSSIQQVVLSRLCHGLQALQMVSSLEQLFKGCITPRMYGLETRQNMFTGQRVTTSQSTQSSSHDDLAQSITSEPEKPINLFTMCIFSY